MVWRTAHGDQKERGRLVVQESVPADELPLPPNAAPGGAKKPNGRKDRDATGKFLPRNGCAKRGRRAQGIRLAPGGMWEKLEAKWPEEWRAARHNGRHALRHRIAEMVRTHGDLSSGVCAILTEAYEIRADARYLRAIAADPARGSDETKAARVSMVDLIRLANQLSTSARQAERDAWELATREAQARKADVDPLDAARQRVLETTGEPGRSDKDK